MLTKHVGMETMAGRKPERIEGPRRDMELDIARGKGRNIFKGNTSDMRRTEEQC